MKVEIWWIGKHNEKFIEAGVQTYLKKVNYFTKVEHRLFNDVKSVKDATVLKQKEAEQFIYQIKVDDYIVLLDEHGKQYNSRQFAEFIVNKQNIGSIKRLVFIIGGAFGFDDTLKQKANALLSLSNMTFSHQLARVIFLEQLYRAYSIIHNFPYHND
ncbi:MAG: 23S rRNA (pseudouridine(1915)-N(3))-methyltransferase RlmH [Chitinophagales bacterium]|nr:23S rRNA (pseudouridine(1915)-N(3))-methyltransferase RlmH [Chitinophagales bacterium]